MARYKDIEKNQGYFTTVYPAEHFDEFSLEKIIDNYVDKLVDTDWFSGKYKNDDVGQKAIHPKVKLKVILYSYANGISSSRRMEYLMRMGHLGYMFLTGNTQMDYSTICIFINDFGDIIAKEFARLLALMEEFDMVDWGKIMIDGTKVSSSADKAMTSDAEGFKKKQERYEKLASKLIERNKRLDKSQEKGELPPNEVENEKRRIERQRKKYNSVIEKIKEYEKDVESGEIDPKDKVNLTDRESKLLNDKDKYIQGYNVQAAYSFNDVIIEIEATHSSNDKPLLEKMVRRVEEIKEENGVKEKSIYLNDKGYFNTRQMKNLIEDEIDIYVACPKDFNESWYISGKHKVEIRGEEKYLVCSDGRERMGRYSKTEGKYRFEVTREFCTDCDKTEDCWKGIKKESKRKSFTVIKTYVDDKEMWDDYKKKMESEEGIHTYNRRIGKEHNFHDLKSNEGLGRIERRGEEKSNIVTTLAGIAHNFKKLRKFLIESEEKRDMWRKLICQT